MGPIDPRGRGWCVLGLTEGEYWILLPDREGDEMARRGYPPEFRRRVVKLIESGRKVAEVAADLEISAQSIYTWCRPGLSSA